jgi:hypothetical protein
MIQIDKMPRRFKFGCIPAHIRVDCMIRQVIDMRLKKYHHIRRKGQYRQPVDTFVGEKTPVGLIETGRMKKREQTGRKGEQ